MPRITLEIVRRAVALPDFDHGSAQERMAPRPRGMLPENKDIPPREAGVLALVFPDFGGELNIVLTRRTDHLRGHSGQISFPGGRRDPEDSSFIMTALRETCEELGLCDEIEVLGQLSPFYIPPSHYNVYPSVGTVPGIPQFNPNPHEVAEVFAVPLEHLLDPRFKDHEVRTFNDRAITIPFYQLNGHKVWGATAVMLSELEERLRLLVEGGG